MTVQLTPGSLKTHYQAKQIQLRTIQSNDDAHMDAVLALVPEAMQSFFEQDPGLLPSLFADGKCLRRYRRVSMPNLEQLRAAWEGQIGITVKEGIDSIEVWFAFVD